MSLRVGAGSPCLLAVVLAMGCAVTPSDGLSSGFTSQAPPAAEGPGDTTTGEDSTGTSGSTGDGEPGTGNVDGSSDDGSSDDIGCIPADEVCDGEDNDCNGLVDEGNPGGGIPCETGVSGVCAIGSTSCENGGVACVSNTAASDERCNGLDDDCNGEIDDGNPEGGDACDTGLLGVCSQGVTECAFSSVDCLPVVSAQAELCDNLDNDCNGVIDDDNPEGGTACDTGLAGICGAGTQQCSAGVLECRPDDEAAPAEICDNGLDDDCNGEADDDCSTCAHDICEAGVALAAGCETCVLIVCGTDPGCCNVEWDDVCVGLTSNCPMMPCG